jgi:esterase/lipase superfamily enzyme
MRRRWAPLFVFFLAIGAGLGSTKCMALPVLDAAIVVQICRALLNKVPGQLPGIVQRQAGQDFVERYGPSYYPMPLDGCLSAVETERASTSETTFLLQHIRYESYWEFWFDGESIKYIKITRFRPVTLAGDEPWQESARSVTPPHRYAADGKAARNEWTPGQNDDPRVVEFLYATNRKKSADPVRSEKSTLITDDGAHDSNGWRPISGYSGERSPDLSFGAVRVRIPDTHRIGRIELASNVKIFGVKFSSDDTEPSKHFIIRGIEETNEDRWIRFLSSTNGKKALIFIHGFNTKFRDAAFRTAQIVWDLQFLGTTVLFSWPSRGEIADYDYDRDSALGSRYGLLHVIDDLHQAGFDNIDIIAHSMGNLLAVEALSNIASNQSSPTVLAQLVMAAPDVDRDLFTQEIPRLAKVTKGLTLYASKNDKALQLSKRVGGNIPRAGDVPSSGPIVSPSISTIDVSAIGDELFGLNHNTFAATRNVLDDLKILLDTGKPPPRLTEIRGYPEPPQKAIYFRYVP